MGTIEKNTDVRMKNKQVYRLGIGKWFDNMNQ